MVCPSSLMEWTLTELAEALAQSRFPNLSELPPGKKIETDLPKAPRTPPVMPIASAPGKTAVMFGVAG